MNPVKQIKLSISSALLNTQLYAGTPRLSDILAEVKATLQAMQDELGSLEQIRLLHHHRLGQGHIKRIYSLKFDACVLCIRLVFDQFRNRWHISGFEVQTSSEAEVLAA